MSLWADYKKEREGKHVIENEVGFFIYSISNTDLYIEDIFISKEYRRSGAASALADMAYEIGKKKGCKRLLGTIVPHTNGSSDSMIFQLKYGMKLLSCSDNLIWLYKEIR